MKPNQVTEKVIGAAIKIHRKLGPGLLESAYEACLAYELEQLIPWMKRRFCRTCGFSNSLSGF